MIEVSLGLWITFILIVIALLAFDLGVLNKKDHVIGIRESLYLSAFYIVIAVIFGAWIWSYFGAKSGMEYFTGYLIEKTLSLDNIFVIALIFKYFDIPRMYQHRVLFYGILGVIVLRAIFIGLGAAAVANAQWILYFFGAFLIYTGIKMLMTIEEPPMDVGNNPMLKLLRRYFPLTDRYDGNRFFTHQPNSEGKLIYYATPLFVALCLIEFADLIFAVDSIPAIFAITREPFIVYTSNIFAILGLRALFFALEAMLHRFHYLKYSLSIVLIFIGLKLFYVEIMGTKLPPAFTLAVTFALIGGGVIYSLYRTRHEGGETSQDDKHS